MADRVGVCVACGGWVEQRLEAEVDPSTRERAVLVLDVCEQCGRTEPSLLITDTF